MAVPIKLQSALFSKILSFDRSLKTRADGEIIVGIVYQRRFRRSLNTKNKFIDVMSSAKRHGDFKFGCVPIDIGDHTDLADAISKRDIDILYITPLRVVEIETITAVSRAKQILTLTGVPEYVKSGLAVGIGIKGERPQIMINLPGAKAEGANSHSQLLKLAEIVK